MEISTASRGNGVLKILLGMALLLVVSEACLTAAARAQSAASRPALSEPAHPLDPALRMATRCLKYIDAEITDYTAVIIKRERVKGKLLDEQYLFAKIRNRKAEGNRVKVPFAVYLKFLKPKSVRGREVIWEEGKNKNRLVAHEGGLINLLRVNLDPNGMMAMVGQRYPIGKIGFENLVSELIVKGQRDRKRGECTVKFYKNAKIAKRVCTKIEVTHPVERPYFEFYRAQIYIDDELKVPIHYAAWSWPKFPGGPPELIERYTYSQLKLNVGLTEQDFDPDNPDYNFP